MEEHVTSLDISKKLAEVIIENNKYKGMPEEMLPCELIDKIFSLLSENFQVEVECPECKHSDTWKCAVEQNLRFQISCDCPCHRNKGKVLRLATQEEISKGGVLILRKEKP